MLKVLTVICFLAGLSFCGVGVALVSWFAFKVGATLVALSAVGAVAVAS